MSFKKVISVFLKILEAALIFLPAAIIFYSNLPKSTPMDEGRRIISIFFMIAYFLGYSWIQIFFSKEKQSIFDILFPVYMTALFIYVLVLSSIGCMIPIGSLDYLAIFLFSSGLVIMFKAEFKKYSIDVTGENIEVFYSKGLYRFSRNMDLFGQLVLFSGWVILTRNSHIFMAPVLIGIIYIRRVIPNRDDRLTKKYGETYKKIMKRTKKLIPFIY